MTDTPPHILQKQVDIYLSKSLKERLLMTADMIEFGVNQAMAIVKRRNPDKSPNELKLEFFKFYYQDDFSPEKMEMWLEKMRKEWGISSE